MNLEQMRSEYMSESLDRKDLAPSPFEQLEKWFEQVIKLDILYPNAITLATVDTHHRPTSRVVLAKEILPEGVIFYTDYTSSKGIDLQTNKNAAINFFWRELDRQVRIQGIATKIDPEKSEEYFLSRPFESKISALASNQSSPISKTELEKRVIELKKMYAHENVPYPHNWGGYIVSYDKVEFWQGRPSRRHDRFEYVKMKDGWKVQRLAP